MNILNTKIEDIDAVFKIYHAATAHQKKVAKKSWRGFERSLIEQEIAENRHFVIKENEEVVCTFVLTFDDAIIWKEANLQPSVYIHRIATNPDFRGRNYVKKIVDWTVNYAKEHKKLFVRLDTHSGNERINEYYISCGFTYKGISEIEWTSDLPEHYKEGSFSLFEIKI